MGDKEVIAEDPVYVTDSVRQLAEIEDVTALYGRKAWHKSEE